MHKEALCARAFYTHAQVCHAPPTHVLTGQNGKTLAGKPFSTEGPPSWMEGGRILSALKAGKSLEPLLKSLSVSIIFSPIIMRAPCCCIVGVPEAFVPKLTGQ